MGLPQINIEFVQKAITAIARSANGIVALIVSDSTKTDNTSYSYAYAADLSKDDWSASNLNLIKTAFTGGPNKVLIERVIPPETYEAALARLKNKKWNWLVALPTTAEGTLTDETVKLIYDWIVEQRAAKKTFKAVLPDTENLTMNNEGVVCFATDKIKCSAVTYSTAAFCARIAGLIAGTAMTNAVTYATIAEAESIEESTTPTEDLDSGKMILINDGAKIKIADEVTSLHVLTEKQSEDLKSIKTIEGMDLIRDDIRDTFENQYVGVNNSYDNKMIFIGGVKQYFRQLETEGVLYDEYDNAVDIDVEGQRAWLAEKYDVSEMSDDEIRKAKTGKGVFVAADVQFCDTIKDLNFGIAMS